MVTATSCPRRSPSSRVHRSRAAVESSTGPARSPSRSTTQCSSATAALSWTIRSPTRKDDGQWIDPTASPSRHGRTPSTSPRWLPRCAATAPSCRALELVTARSAPWPTGATWSASTAISPRCRHQTRPNGPASSIVVWSDVTMPGSRNTACTIIPSPAPGRSTSAAISESVRGDVDSRSRPLRRTSVPTTVTRSSADESTVVTAGPAIETTRVRRAFDHPANASTRPVTSSAAISAMTTGVPVSRAISPATTHAAMSDPAPGDGPRGRVCSVATTVKSSEARPSTRTRPRFLARRRRWRSKRPHGGPTPAHSLGRHRSG